MTTTVRSSVRLNLPTTQQEVEIPDGVMLVSTTDTQGKITHCNAPFVAVSGFGYDELLGQPHNIVRHPDMPPEAFKDLWATVGRGRPWSGVVKNRCKNGDYYWVHANVTPVIRNGRNVGYISLRQKPTREQIAQAQKLYEHLGRVPAEQRKLKLHAGGVRWLGPRDWPFRIFRMSLTQRVAMALAGWTGAVAACLVLGSPETAIGLGLAALAAGASLFLAWFHRSVSEPLRRCSDMTARIAGCNLGGDLGYDMRHPVGQLIRNVQLIDLNMQAIVEDVRSEVGGMVRAAVEISSGSQDLAARTEHQSANVERTASAMEQITSVVRQTADAARRVEESAESARARAAQGGDAVEVLVETMLAIDSASSKVAEVIQVIEGIAFQTNLLSLNAAVEAARAGEHGRGFAVVASEVRALANRCTLATKEIRDLINASMQEVQRGSTHVTSTAEIIRKIIGSSHDVSALVREITHAAAEQSGGVDDVHRAIGEIEQTTQQNAALAEQTAAASECLRGRAGTLTRSVQIFH